MSKLRNKKNSKSPHISYKYIIAFCATFAICNFFVEEIANKNEGKNSSQVQNIRFMKSQLLLNIAVILLWGQKARSLITIFLLNNLLRGFLIFHHHQ